MTSPISGQNSRVADLVIQVQEETALALYTEPPQDTLEDEATSSGFAGFKSFCAGVKSFFIKEKEERPSPFTFQALMGRDPLDCTIYENALKCLGFKEEEAKNREALDKRYQTCISDHVKSTVGLSERHPLSNIFELMRHERESAYRTLIERLHSEA